MKKFVTDFFSSPLSKRSEILLRALLFIVSGDNVRLWFPLIHLLTFGPFWTQKAMASMKSNSGNAFFWLSTQWIVITIRVILIIPFTMASHDKGNIFISYLQYLQCKFMKRKLLFQELYMGEKLDEHLTNSLWKYGFIKILSNRIKWNSAISFLDCVCYFWIRHCQIHSMFVADTTSLHAPQEMFKYIDSKNVIILKRSNHFCPILFYSQWFVSISMSLITRYKERITFCDVKYQKHACKQMPPSIQKKRNKSDPWTDQFLQISFAAMQSTYWRHSTLTIDPLIFIS